MRRRPFVLAISAFALFGISEGRSCATTIRWNAGFDGFRPGDVYFAASVQFSNTGLNRSVTLFRYSPSRDEVAEIVLLPGRGEFPSRQLAFHPFGDGLFIGSADGIKLLQPDGRLVDFAPRYSTIWDLNVGSDGAVFTSETAGVRKYDRVGSASVFSLNTTIWGLAIRPDGGFVAGVELNQIRYGNNNLLWLSPSGEVEKAVSVSAGQLGLVRARADGTFVAVSDSNTTLNLVQPSGSYRSFAGWKDGIASTHGIAVDRDGHVWVSTGGRPAALQQFSVAGTRLMRVLLELSNLVTSAETGFFSPSGVAVAPVVIPRPLPIAKEVLNAASIQPGIASGAWIAIKGANLATTTRLWGWSDFSGNRLPTQLDGTSVTINGKYGYIYYISPSQVNVLSPDDDAQGSVQVQVMAPQGDSVPVQAQKGLYAPAFFMFDPEGRKYIAAIHPNGTYLGRPGLFGTAVLTRPATPGGTAVLYGTGFGSVAPPTPTGQLVTLPGQLTAPVTVWIGGLAAPVGWSGLVSPGLYQINVRVPEVPDGDASVVAEISGFRTQANAFITVQR
jgi:uncharacterized protein (TIGR03437 family)